MQTENKFKRQQKSRLSEDNSTKHKICPQVLIHIMNMNFIS